MEVPDYIAQVLIFPVKTFALSTLYAFLSANLIGLTLNLFAGVLLSDQVSCSKRVTVYVPCVLFFLASLAFFLVSWLLEDARNAWISENAPREPAKRDFHIRVRRIRLLGFFFSGVMLTTLGAACLLLPANPLNRLVELLSCPIPSLWR